MIKQTMKAFVLNLVSQANAALAIIGSIQGTWKAKLYKELGLKSLKSRRWFRRFCYFHKIKTFGLSSYLSNLILSDIRSYNTWNSEDLVTYQCRIGNFKYSFFHWIFLEQSGTLYQSRNSYPDSDIVTRSGIFYSSFEGDSYRFRKPNLFIFISAREFSFLHFPFNLLKNFTKF